MTDQAHPVTSPDAEQAAPERDSTQIAADTSLMPVWDPATPFPAFDRMPDLDIVTHISVERAVQGGFHYLHETALAFHEGALWIAWGAHPVAERNLYEEVIRGSRSYDGGFTWEPPVVWAQPPDLGSESFNHPVLATHQGKLWGFFTAWNEGQPRTEIYTHDAASDKWQPTGARIDGLLPFGKPKRMANGNWYLSGEKGFEEAAVAISHGDDFTKWDLVTIPNPQELPLLYPEVTVIDQGDRLLALCRAGRRQRSAPASISTDGGRTWQGLQMSNMPIFHSMPFAGTLSTGQHFFLSCNLEEGRAMLSLAVTEPGGRLFKRIWKVRHSQWPRRRLFGGVKWVEGKPVESYAGRPTEWSYPFAIEQDGKLYISYTHGKEDAVLSIVPISVLAV